MIRRVPAVPLLVFALALSFPLAASVPGGGEDRAPELTLERIFAGEPIEGRLPAGLGWRPGHEQVVLIEKRGKGEDEREVLVGVSAATGERVDLLDAATLPGAEDGAPPALDGFLFSPDGGSVLVPLDGGFVLADLENGTAAVLDCSGGRFPAFSPDGRRIAYVRDHDLYVYDLATGREERLSHDGSETVFNGEFDWVYTEELAGRDPRAFMFSPDGSAILWLRTDDSAIAPYHLVDLLGERSRVTEQRYPLPGDMPPAVRLEAAWFGPKGTARARLTIEPEEAGGLVPRFGWMPDGRGAWCQWIDRAQERIALLRIDLPRGDVTVLHEERDPYWVEPTDLFHVLADGRFLWGSRSSGYMHIQLRAADGTLVRDLTPGPFDVTTLVGVDEATGTVWYQAARPNPRERRLYRVRLDGSGLREVSHGHGTHSAVLSPGHSHLLVRRSTATVPPVAVVVRGDGTEEREIAATDREAIAALGLAEPRFVTVTADDGTPLEAVLLAPENAAAEDRKLPAVVYVYGGPHAQVVRYAWGRGIGLFHQWLVRQGVVVFALDNRGSAGRGRRFEGAIDWHLGRMELADQLAGVRWLSERPFVDPERIGIWGWSYGGYMTCYALTHAPGTFAAGVAVAPVTDWRLYDSIYTERYMGTPEENPDGYDESSVLTAIGQLDGSLLVLHGTGDDNVHVQHTLQLADRAWRAGKRFDLVLFPNLRHGLRAKGSTLAVFRTIADHLLDHLGVERPGR